MKVLFVLEYFYPHIGGVETSFLALARELAKDNEVAVITTWLPNTRTKEVYENIKIQRVKTPRFARRFWFTFLSLWSVITAAKSCDYIHTTLYNAALPAWIASKLCKKKIVLTVPEIFGKKWFGLGEKSYILAFLFYLYEKLILSLKFDLYIAISKSTKTDLLKNFSIPQNKIEVIYCILDLEFWDPRKYDGTAIRKKYNLDNKFVYLYYGRPGISKGLEYLLAAVKDISKNIPNSKLFLILSHDPLNRYEMMKKIIDETGTKKSVVLIDPVPYKELPNYIMAADCVVVPSLTEGFGYCAVETNLMGKPLIATKVGAIPEISSLKVYIKPKSSKDIIEQVRKVYSNSIDDLTIREIRMIRSMLNNQKIISSYRKTISVMLNN